MNDRSCRSDNGIIVCVACCRMPDRDPSSSSLNSDAVSWYHATPCVTLSQYSTGLYLCVSPCLSVCLCVSMCAYCCCCCWVAPRAIHCRWPEAGQSAAGIDIRGIHLDKFHVGQERLSKGFPSLLTPRRTFPQEMFSVFFNVACFACSVIF